MRRYCRLFEATLSSGNQDKACLCGMIGAELASLNHPAVEQVREFSQNSEERISTILMEGRQTGDFRFVGEVTALAALIFAALQGGLLLSRVRGGAQKLHREIEQLITLVKTEYFFARQTSR
ncbi:TetR family transcriptional regulator C-terminal domain-containing protein [Romeria aff. gracilis LEGE 07310]|uniref:TetR family transcriptional regulator C-terminal domain-containing protein n=1 Tax=Vasconcelosia minhoensis LEGE 07310 TaxID=915328 RepID=A0A8J7DMI2_9CYAN|nr:TetR family transcriptional regulator C-terminal domain-containing protein [Romeria gracilis]MBE9076730.1 TetR family transcriptional regulator C-terminal domain-containing protein [Romeria aff. gracilis LEGE 07310]